MAGRRRPRRQEVYSIQAGYPPTVAARRYNPRLFPDTQTEEDTNVGILGRIDEWDFEVCYRYTIYRGLTVDWAITVYAMGSADESPKERRLVQRTDICHSELHVHDFRRSSNPEDKRGVRTALQSLSAGDEAKVDEYYERQLLLLDQEWQQRCRRWLDG